MSDYEHIHKTLKEVDSKFKEREELKEKNRIDELNKMGVKPFASSQYPKERCDHPSTMERSTATIIWIVVMIVGSIFKINWIIWIVATIVWLKFIRKYK